MPPRMLKREGLVATRKDTRHAYARLGLQVRAKRRKRPHRPPSGGGSGWPRRPGRTSAGRPASWSGQPVATPVSGARPALFLDELGKAAAPPVAVVCDNGSESASKAMRFWGERSGATPDFIQPGKPTMSAFVESFDGKFRDSCLKATGSWASPTSGASWTTGATTNHEWPHGSLGCPTPAERAMQAVPFHSLGNWTCFRGKATVTQFALLHAAIVLASVLLLVTIIISLVAHNIIAMSVVVLLAVATLVCFFRKRSVQQQCGFVCA